MAIHCHTPDEACIWARTWMERHIENLRCSYCRAGTGDRAPIETPIEEVPE
ncbi:MAG: hypothetical protein GDA41_08235 [Rhodospirillales bacterium]|nr:hypothetical protein [Rhodospirillales bacterium]